MLIGRGSSGLEENRCHYIKKEKKEVSGNYRPTSLTVICWKVMEHIFQEAISKCMEKKVVTVSRFTKISPYIYKGNAMAVQPDSFYNEKAQWRRREKGQFP